MAKFSNASGSLYLNVYIEPGTQNIANNTTVVNWRMTVSRTGAYYTYNHQGDSTLSLDLNGGRVHTSNPTWQTSGEEFQMASGSTTVGHNADGTKSFGFSATFNPNNGLHGVITVSGNISLATIPRSSSVSVGAGVIGSAVTININRQSSSFKHTVRYAWGNKSGTIASNVDTSTTWTIPLDFANDIPNSTSGVGTIYVDTYSGTTKIGTSSSTLSLSVPTSVVPTIDTKKVEETVAGLNTQFGNYVQNKSKIKATMTASGTHGSTIKSYKITANGETFNAESGTTSELKTSGTNRVNFEVTDSRGRQATSYIDISVTAYENPKILSVSASRANADGTLNDEGTYAKISFNASVAPVGNKNTKAFIVKYKKTGSTTWAEVDVTGATYSMNTHMIVAGFDVDYAYDIQLYVADYFTSITFSPIPLPTGFTMINYHPDGKAVAFGEVSDGFGFSVNLNAQFKKSVDIAGDIYAGGKQIQQHQITKNNGLAFFYGSGFDFNAALLNQQISCNNPANGPTVSRGPNQFYVEVIAESNNYLTQRAVQKETGRTFVRTRHAGTWSPWVETALTNHPNLINTGWISTGVAGVYYKRHGDVVALKMQVTTTANQAYGLGSIPVALLPIQNSGAMMRVASWTGDQSFGRNLPIYGDGTMVLLPTNRGDTFNTQVTWII